MRLVFGLALLPSSLITLFIAARTLALLAAGAPDAFPFLGGLGVSLLLWTAARWFLAGAGGAAGWVGVMVRRLYVFGHELTHALAAWSIGAKVHAFHVGEEGGHVDLSHSNAFIALAPYCAPIYTLLVVVGYRLLLWLRPGWAGQTGFLVLMGLTLAFHFLLTFECLWDRKQPDLAAGGGVIFSLALIVLANGLVVLLVAKTLFPKSVLLGEPLRQICVLSAAFWSWGYREAHGVGRLMAGARR
ncbi:MAG: hypothetical protein AAB320_06195 [Elusimicrobiota bacterium]